MTSAFFTAMFAVFLAFLGRRERNHSYLLLTAFVILTAFLSLGYYWGNDVATYEEWFQGFEKSGIAWWNLSQYENFTQKEYGFVLVNLLCKPLGFWGMRALLFVIENAIIYTFIVKHVERRWYWLAVFIYVFNPNYWVLSSSMMRQWLAICIVILGVMCLEKKKYFYYFLLSLFAFSVHFSALVSLAFWPLSLLQKKNSMSSFVILAASLIVFWILSPIFIDYVVLFLKAEDFYQLGYMDTHGGVGISSVIFLLINTFVLYCSVKYKQQNNLVCWIVILGALVMPLLAYGELISRIGFYFSIFTIAAYPLFMENKKVDRLSKSAVLSIIVLYNIYMFFLFFNSPTWVKAYGTYQSLIGNI